MKSSTIISIIIIVLLVLGGYFWWSMGKSQTPPVSNTSAAPTGTGANAGTAQPAPSAAIVATLSVSSGHLVGTNGMTLYTYGKDIAGGPSSCTGGCATNWPPYTLSEADAALLSGAAGVSGKIATITRSDKKLQVTYNGKPLYFWIKDSTKTDVTGDGIGGFSVAKP